MINSVHGNSLRQLEYFVTVVDEGSFTRAADTCLQVSQPGLSHQIQALERELGGPLLERLPAKGAAHPGRPHRLAARTGQSGPSLSAPAARPGGHWVSRPASCNVGTLYSISTGIPARSHCVPGGATPPNSRSTWSSCATPAT